MGESYWKSRYAAKMKQKESAGKSERDYDPILDEYASLMKNKNPRARTFHLTHRKRLDDIIRALSEEIRTLKSSTAETDQKRLAKLDKKYGHLLSP